MASSGGKPRSSLSERQMVGLFSLGLGVVLFLLILMRGQQAAREGNQEFSNDTYWVLVSPLVFSAFGVVLLRSPKAGAGARGRALVQSQRTTQSAQAALARVDEGASQQLAQARAEAAAALAALESLQGEQDRTAAQAGAKIRALQAELSAAQQARVQLEANLRRDLVTQTADTSRALAAVQWWRPSKPNARWRSWLALWGLRWIRPASSWRRRFRPASRPRKWWTVWSRARQLLWLPPQQPLPVPMPS